MEALPDPALRSLVFHIYLQENYPQLCQSQTSMAQVGGSVDFQMLSISLGKGALHQSISRLPSNSTPHPPLQRPFSMEREDEEGMSQSTSVMGNGIGTVRSFCRKTQEQQIAN